MLTDFVELPRSEKSTERSRSRVRSATINLLGSRIVLTTLRLAFALLVSAECVKADDWLDQVWPEAKIYIKTGSTNRIYLQYASTRTREDGYSDGQIGAHMDFYFAPVFKGRELRHPDASRNKMLMIRAGYYHAKTPANSPDPFTEHTALIEATPRFFLPKQVLVESRFRCDFRFLDGVYTPRFRNRLRIERPFALPRTSLNPYSEFEPFYDWRYRSFHRQRYSAGVEWLLHKRFVFEAYYLRQHDSQSSREWTDVIGFVLQFYLR